MSQMYEIVALRELKMNTQLEDHRHELNLAAFPPSKLKGHSRVRSQQCSYKLYSNRLDT